MNVGFFIAQKQDDGTPGRPIGMAIDDSEVDGGIMMFEELPHAIQARERMQADMGTELSIFKVNLAFVGEVIL